MTYKAIIFDLGQVIFKAGFTRRYNILCKEYNIDPGEGPFREFRDIWNKAKVGEIDSAEFFKVIAEKLKTSPEEIKNLLVNEIALDERVKDLILKLKDKYRIGFLTNNIKEFYEADKALWNFEEVGEVVASFKDHVKKPDMEAMDKVLEKMQLQKEDVLFVDDKNNTTSIYNKAGIRSITFDGYDEFLINLRNLGVEL